MSITCDFGPDDLWRLIPCVGSVSKNLEGELLALGAEKEECPKLDCVTLTTLHAIRGRLAGGPCDSGRTARLDGPFVVDRLTTIFEAGDARHRGVHAGEFRWFHRGLVIDGRMQGVTNAGVMRDPLRQPCEECANPGVMLGRLCGRVRRCFFDPGLIGAVVTGIYRFEFDPTEAGGQGALIGVLEGALIQACPQQPSCVDFTGLLDSTNPRIEQGHRFEVFDHQGNPQPTTEIRTWGNVTGLHLWFRTVIDLAAPASVVRLTVGRFATEGTATAFDSTGAQVAQILIAGPQNMPLVLSLPGPDIVRVEISCPQDEHLLTQICVEQ
jgi:hypothetical protein